MKERFEVAKVRVRTVLSSLLRLVGVGLILLGSWNLFGVLVGMESVLTAYRVIGVASVDESTMIHLGDGVLIALGIAVAWLR